jgi:hypothetical protein
MSASQTATVETLTAQVRVLMVGSKQVTASVAKQLDYVHNPAIVNVFGRVRIPGQVQQAIGATTNAELVLTGKCDGGGFTNETFTRTDDAGPYTFVCECGRDWSLADGNSVWARSRSGAMHWYCSHANDGCPCTSGRPCPYDQQWLNALPLIVLAGLR